ncbi:glycosyltransferase family 90 protein [Athelia psychrophila]|uniref:Glycosyltransferase family 90 protein n=1 Tax=Athelia psychrophila TaxID=1759441 RepID=A0A166C429_9AGAM|nr:glycosyltransferase family 90 protein [Fibularhizoctonia sp. CBS 109695]
MASMASNRRMRRMVVIPCVVATSSSSPTSGTPSLRPSPLSPLLSPPRGGEPGNKATGEHVFLANGLMEVNPDGRHPMFDLMDRGAAQWDAKLERQSTTLEEAVREYKRRHGRAPPKGFDHWWYWCEKHDVRLPDEYDQIHRDLAPFWGMHPADLARLQSDHEAHVDSYTIGKDRASDPIGVLKMVLSYSGPGTQEDAHLEQAQDMIDSLADVQHFVPPFRATFSPHDNPNLFSDWEVKTDMLRAAAAGEYIDLSHPPERWTPARTPSLLHHSSQFLSSPRGPVPDRLLIPQFSMCKTLLHGDIRPATPIAWVADTDPAEDVPWAAKAEERLLWRGTDSGIWAAAGSPWRGSQRNRLVRLANARNGTVRILPPRATRGERVGAAEAWRATRVNPAMMDVVFAGHPGSCEAAVCDMMRTELPFTGEHMGHAEAGAYKYVFDTDGNGWSSRFKRLMVSRALVFKSTVYPEWYAGRVQEYVHYVPAQMDYADLHDALAFFRGGLNGENGHDDLAEQIAGAGRAWARAYWRREDLTAYMFRLMLEYARLFSLDREAASYGDANLEQDLE